jgi:hypothetical protein
VAGEPYYAGLFNLGTPYPLRAVPDSETDRAQVRSGLYGSFLSGAFGGVIYGAEGIWQADTEAESVHPMWRSFLWRSGGEVKHLAAFAGAAGSRLTELVPEAELIVPNKSGPVVSYTGWAFAAATRQRDLVLGYFEPGCPDGAEVRSLPAGRPARLRWFDPRTGDWSAMTGDLTVRASGVLELPDRPDAQDWGFELRL